MPVIHFIEGSDAERRKIKVTVIDRKRTREYRVDDIIVDDAEIIMYRVAGEVKGTIYTPHRCYVIDVDVLPKVGVREKVLACTKKPLNEVIRRVKYGVMV